MADAISAPPVAVVRSTLDAADPITMLFIDATIEVMLVAKDSLALNNDRIARNIWGVAGIYVLLGPSTPNDDQVSTDPALALARTLLSL